MADDVTDGAVTVDTILTKAIDEAAEDADMAADVTDGTVTVDTMLTKAIDEAAEDMVYVAGIKVMERRLNKLSLKIGSSGRFS
jgi:hypothetical protein